jgi:hypothetical protein
MSTTDVVETLRTALGRPARLFPIGSAAASAVRRMPLLGGAARSLYGSLELSDAHFRRSYAWSPVVDIRTALIDVVTHMRVPAGQ